MASTRRGRVSTDEQHTGMDAPEAPPATLEDFRAILAAFTADAVATLTPAQVALRAHAHLLRVFAICPAWQRALAAHAPRTQAPAAHAPGAQAPGSVRATGPRSPFSGGPSPSAPPSVSKRAR